MPFDQVPPERPAPEIENDPVLRALMAGHKMIQQCWTPFTFADAKGGHCTLGVVGIVLHRTPHIRRDPTDTTEVLVRRYLDEQAVKPKTNYPRRLAHRDCEIVGWDTPHFTGQRCMTHNNLNGKEATIEMWRKAVEKRRADLMAGVATAA